jgi:hypothetical protein
MSLLVLVLANKFQFVSRRSSHYSLFLQSPDVWVIGHITRTSNKWLRRNLIECARVAVRKDPHVKDFYLALRHERGEKKGLDCCSKKACLLCRGGI